MVRVWRMAGEEPPAPQPKSSLRTVFQRKCPEDSSTVLWFFVCTLSACTLAVMPQSHPKSKGQLSWNESKSELQHLNQQSVRVHIRKPTKWRFRKPTRPNRSWRCAGAPDAAERPPDANLNWSGLSLLILRKSTMDSNGNTSYWHWSSMICQWSGWICACVSFVFFYLFLCLWSI